MGMDLGKIIHKINYKATFLLYQILPGHILSPNLGKMILLTGHFEQRSIKCKIG